MKKVIRIVAGIALIALGVGSVFLGGYALWHTGDWLSFVFFICVGASFGLAGWGIARGENVMSILRELFMNLMRG